MGSGTSRPHQLATNEALLRFVSPEALSPEHPFWNGLLSFQMKTPRTRSDWKALEESVEELLKRFTTNNLKSGNLGALVQIFLSRQEELKSSLETDSSLFVWQTFNALYILRVCIKFFVERLKEEDVFRQFCAHPSRRSGDEDKSSEEGQIEPGRRFAAFIESLINIEIDLPNSELTYGLHCETVTTLLILLSTPLFSQTPAFQQRAFREVFASDGAIDLTSRLVTNFSLQAPAPAVYLSEEGGSVVLGIASGVWNILTFGYSSVAAPPESATVSSTKPLADVSLLLLLVLTNHCTDSDSVVNPYRRILFNCSNITTASTKNNNANPTLNGPTEATEEEEMDNKGSFQADFGKLFKTLCETLANDESTLFLYLLLHQSRSFRTHVLASSDIERIVVPILKILYHAPDSSNHHIYMSLIVLLILSEDDLFNTSVHDIMIKHIDWYTERPLQDISLGGLIILVVIRTIQYNMLKMRDKYLHTNCLAALANMSSQFKNLHPYVSQRIVSMFETLSKKHSRLVSTLHHSEGSDGLEDDSVISEALADVSVLEEVLRMILEIINSCLVSQTKSNSNLIYTLLYKRELFEPFITHPSFQDLSQNLQTVIIYFNSKLEQIQERKERTLSVNEVQDVIRQTALQFPREKLTKFPDLKFKYVEEDQPEDFFVPYVWTLATQKIFFNPANIKLIEQS